jgi:hypothetical protein
MLATNPAKREIHGFKRSVERMLKGKNAKTQGVASGRYAVSRRVLAKKAIPTAGKQLSRRMVDH